MTVHIFPAIPCLVDADEPFAELRRRLRGDDDQGDDRGLVDLRKLGLAAGGVVLLALAVVIVSAGRAVDQAPPEPLAPTSDTVADAGSEALDPPDAPAQVWPAEPVEIVGTEVRTGGHRWSVGSPGDLLAVGDWDCDGTATPAVVRPSSRRLYLFDGWATEGADLTATAGPPVPPDATAIEPDGCGAVTLRTADGAAHRIETASS